MNKLIDFLRDDAPPWVWTGIAAAISLLVVILLMRLFRVIALRAISHHTTLGMIVRRTNSPLTAMVALIALNLVWQAAPDDLAYIDSVRHTTGVLWIMSVTWLLLRSVGVAGDAVVQLNPFDVDDNLRARSVLTQTRVLTRTVSFLILLIGLSLALMTFPGVRQIGASLLASAGIAGLAVGLAAKPVLGNLLAGLQLALTQPIRIDDVLVLEGEWGRVEEITGTYVVVAIWDQRRLIVPLQYFIEKPFQNWTRESTNIIGSVFINVDYRAPVENIRSKLSEIARASPLWDGKVVVLQVTDATERSIQLRALVSASNSPKSWDLRCEIREKLLAFLNAEYPECLPRLRLESETFAPKV